ncbi:MAG: cyclic nucleotide-binding domain-containing protein [Myxococcota bacterium]
MASLSSVLAESALFSSLDEAAKTAVARCLKARKLADGEALFRQGDAGDFLGIVIQGTLAVSCRDVGGAEVEVARLGRGELFGEMSCLDPAPRSATVIAEGPALVGTLDRRVLATLRASVPSVAVRIVDAIAQVLTSRLRVTNERIRVATDGDAPRTAPVTRTSPAMGERYPNPLDLRSVDVLAAYSDSELATLAQVAPPLVYKNGEVLCYEGGRADACYLVAGGEVEVIKHLAQGPQVLATLGRGAMVGQLALLDDAPRSATVRAKGTTGVLAIRRADFRRLLASHDSLALKLHEQVTRAGIRQLRLADEKVTSLLAPAVAARPATQPGPPRTAQKPRPDRRNWEGESRPPTRDSVARGERVLGGDYLSAALGEWGLSLADLDQVRVAKPDGAMTAAELKVRLNN